MVSLLLAFILLAGPVIGAGSGARSQWPTFKGAYFEVKYPPGFKPRRSLPSNSFEGEFDSAFFTAPDKSVEFYVFSPLWNGQPDDIERNPATEDVVSEQSKQKGAVKTRRVTLKAKDNSYLRSFEDTENTETNTRKVFGIKYRDNAVYAKSRNQYLRFKQSLRQFSD